MAETAGTRSLPLEFYRRETIAVARDLLGKAFHVRHRGVWRSGFIVEDEAYVRDDPANHAYRGPNRRNRSMFKGPGTLYVYTIHGVHCVNVVTQRGEAVLIRALEPRENISRPTNGPGKVGRALGITTDAYDGLAITGPGIRIADAGYPTFELGTSPRIGVTRAKDRALRFYVKGNTYLSA